jgi:hypothetical protein
LILPDGLVLCDKEHMPRARLRVDGTGAHLEQ